jgi:hypothetical protein
MKLGSIEGRFEPTEDGKCGVSEKGSVPINAHQVDTNLTHYFQ